MVTRIEKIIDNLISEASITDKKPGESNTEYRERIKQAGKAHAQKMREKADKDKAAREREPVGPPIKNKPRGGKHRKPSTSSAEGGFVRKQKEAEKTKDLRRRTKGKAQGLFGRYEKDKPEKEKKKKQINDVERSILGIIKDNTEEYMPGWSQELKDALAVKHKAKSQGEWLSIPSGEKKKRDVFNKIRDEYWNLLKDPIEDLVEEPLADVEVWNKLSGEYVHNMKNLTRGKEPIDVPPEEWEKVFATYSPGVLTRASQLKRKLYGDPERHLVSEIESDDPHKSLINLGKFIFNSFNASTGDAIWKTQAEKKAAESHPKATPEPEFSEYSRRGKSEKMFEKNEEGSDTGYAKMLKKEFLSAYDAADGSPEDRRLKAANELNMDYRPIEDFVSTHKNDPFATAISKTEEPIRTPEPEREPEKLDANPFDESIVRNKLVEEMINYSVSYLDHNCILLEDGVDRIKLNLVGPDHLETDNGINVEVEGIANRMKTLSIDIYDVNAIQDAIVDWRYNHGSF